MTHRNYRSRFEPLSSQQHVPYQRAPYISCETSVAQSQIVAQQPITTRPQRRASRYVYNPTGDSNPTETTDNRAKAVGDFPEPTASEQEEDDDI